MSLSFYVLTLLLLGYFVALTYTTYIAILILAPGVALTNATASTETVNTTDLSVNTTDLSGNTTDLSVNTTDLSVNTPDNVRIALHKELITMCLVLLIWASIAYQLIYKKCCNCNIYLGAPDDSDDTPFTVEVRDLFRHRNTPYNHKPKPFCGITEPMMFLQEDVIWV